MPIKNSLHRIFTTVALLATMHGCGKPFSASERKSKGQGAILIRDCGSQTNQLLITEGDHDGTLIHCCEYEDVIEMPARCFYDQIYKK